MSTPWLEGGRVWATCGFLFGSVSAEDLAPEVLRAVAPWSESRPRGIVRDARAGGPWDYLALELPPIEDERPPCPACQGRLARGGTGATRAACRACNGAGTLPCTGEPIAVGAGIHLDRWTVGVLNRHGAKLYPPILGQGQGGRGLLRFEAGAVWGQALPMLNLVEAAKPWA